ncbi:unnamed protein product [Phytophthora lilii]|uniref:Unnamed protein product n=1 Tax=Phytophthora lilii TaxID=2077276 RepID=A0A9W6X440_9STRA|nr:unnamed protein product [Phytophthora lilii]
MRDPTEIFTAISSNSQSSSKSIDTSLRSQNLLLWFTDPNQLNENSCEKDKICQNLLKNCSRFPATAGDSSPNRGNRPATDPFAVMAPPPTAAPRNGSSVARSLAQAAAALRAQEWRGNPPANIGANASANANVGANREPEAFGTRRSAYGARSDAAARQAPRYAPSYPHYREVEQALYDREAFYEELRERHRTLTHRQRLAREFYEQRQQVWRAPLGEENAGDRQRIVVDRTRPHAPATTAQAAGRHFRAPSAQIVATFAPRTGDRRPRDAEDYSQNRTDYSQNRVLAQRTRPVQIDAPAAPIVASPGPAPLPPIARPAQVQIPATSSSSTGGTPKDAEIENEEANAQTAPSVIEDPDNEAEDDGVVVDDDAQKKPKKRVRYLRDTDRRNIVKRIENGEKQAALAREFGVTRAAICHIKKNRFEILSRYNMLVKSAQEMCESLAILGTESVEVITGTGHLYRGLELRHQFCGVAIGAEGFPFLVLFHQMEPEAPQGSIHVAKTLDRHGGLMWRLDHMDLPANIVQYKVFLFSSTLSTGEAECKAIEVSRLRYAFIAVVSDPCAWH